MMLISMKVFVFVDDLSLIGCKIFADMIWVKKIDVHNLALVLDIIQKLVNYRVQETM